MEFFKFFAGLSDQAFEQAMAILDQEAEVKRKLPINRVVELSLVLMLTPHVGGLELMMPDQQLERSLRNSIEKYIARCLRVERMHLDVELLATYLQKHMPSHDLSSKAVISAESVIEMPPNRLTQLCLGYLKIF